MPTVKEILARPYTRCLIPNPNGGWTIYILEFDGLATSGKTVEEAFHNLDEAAGLWLEWMLEHGKGVPEPINKILELVDLK